MNEFVEKRREVRKRSLKRAMIVFNDRYCSTECTVRNESENGAMLLVEQNQAIPSVIEFRQYPNPEYRTAEIMWRSETAIGIRFKPQHGHNPRGDGSWDGVDRRDEKNRRKGERRYAS